MPKFTAAERDQVQSIVANLSIKRIPTELIRQHVFNQTGKTLSRRTLYYIRQRLKRDSYHWYKEMREGEYEYIHEFKERINEIVDLQRMHHEIIKKGLAIIYTDFCDVSEFANYAWARCFATNDNESEYKASNAVTEKKQGNCDPAYPDVCIPPPPPDLDCSDVSEKNFKVQGSDPHRFDTNNDGIGCESWLEIKKSFLISCA